MSDSGLYCRKEIYLPCSRKEEVSQASVVIMHCKHTLRDYVFLREENDKGAHFEECQDQLLPQAKQAPDSKQTELLLSLMARSLKIDDESARYYLEASDYDLKAAMDTYRSDADWESSQRRLSLKKPKENLRFCKTWRDVLEDESVWNECFRLKWGFRDVRGRPKNKLAFYQNASFVRRYQVQNSDSIASIALKHNLSTSTVADG